MLPLDGSHSLFAEVFRVNLLDLVRSDVDTPTPWSIIYFASADTSMSKILQSRREALDKAELVMNTALRARDLSAPAIFFPVGPPSNPRASPGCRA